MLPGTVRLRLCSRLALRRRQVQRERVRLAPERQAVPQLRPPHKQHLLPPALLMLLQVPRQRSSQFCSSGMQRKLQAMREGHRPVPSRQQRLLAAAATCKAAMPLAPHLCRSSMS